MKRLAFLITLAALLSTTMQMAKGQEIPNEPIAEGSNLTLAATAAVTQVLCGGAVPAGWITISINGTCGVQGGTSYISRTIQQISTLPSNTSLHVCGDVPPAGWITT